MKTSFKKVLESVISIKNLEKRLQFILGENKKTSFEEKDNNLIITVSCLINNDIIFLTYEDSRLKIIHGEVSSLQKEALEFLFNKDLIKETKKIKEIEKEIPVKMKEGQEIFYESKKGICKTICPYKGGKVKVGSMICTEKCENFISNDKESSVITCKSKQTTTIKNYQLRGFFPMTPCNVYPDLKIGSVGCLQCSKFVEVDKVNKTIKCKD